MMKKRINKILIILLVLSVIIVPQKANAALETLGDYKRDYETLLKQQQDANNKSAAAKKDIEAKERAIKDAESNLTNARKEEAETQEKIVESNEKIAKLTDEAQNVLLYLQQMQGINSYVEYISGASSMTDLIMRLAAVEQTSKQIQDTMENIKDEIKRNEQLTKELQEKQQKLEKDIISYQEAIKKQYSNINEYDKFATDIDQQVKDAKRAYDLKVNQCKQTIGKTDDSVKVVTCVSAGGNGNWLKPLNSGYITSTIGTRWGSYHNALDIGGNAEGTPVYAAAAGTVSGKIERYRCGGNMLYIDVIVNGKQYTTYYYHLLRFNVNVGDTVTQNTIIGWVGGGRSTSSAYGGYDTCTTGAHLHFGVANGWFSGSIKKGNVITPPGFPNREGYRFYSRYDYFS